MGIACGGDEVWPFGRAEKGEGSEARHLSPPHSLTTHRLPWEGEERGVDMG